MIDQNKIKLDRPIAIIIICFIGAINAVQLIFMVFSPVSSQLGNWYPFYFGISSIFSLFSLAGMWFLKKWAAIMYAVVLISNQLILVSMQLWEVSAILIPMIILILLFNNKDKMS